MSEPLCLWVGGRWGLRAFGFEGLGLRVSGLGALWFRVLASGL